MMGQHNDGLHGVKAFDRHGCSERRLEASLAQGKWLLGGDDQWRQMAGAAIYFSFLYKIALAILNGDRFTKLGINSEGLTEPVMKIRFHAA